MDYRGQTSLPRGIRNNNPGNLKTGISWQGAAGDDGTFIIFADDTWGIRAMATDLLNKVGRGVNTIRDIISVYAPPSENDTDSYINAVAADTGLDPDEVVTLDQPTLHAFVRAIINHENGDSASSAYVSDADIDTGIRMVGQSLQTLFQAGTIAVESNPLQSLAIAVGVVVVLSLAFNK